MKEKLLLVDIRENNKRRSTQVVIYDEAHDILKDLNARTGQSFAMLVNRMIRFAYDHIEIDTENQEDITS